MGDMQRDYGLTVDQAAGAVGNLATESWGFTKAQEVLKPGAKGRGGFGFAQWTGARRRDFERHIAEHPGESWYNLNYGFLKDETRRLFPHLFEGLRQTKTRDEAMHSFFKGYEKAQKGKEHFEKRLGYAERAVPFGIIAGAQPILQSGSFDTARQTLDASAARTQLVEGSGTIKIDVPPASMTGAQRSQLFRDIPAKTPIQMAQAANIPLVDVLHRQ
jgi:hypothetical protein